MEIFAQLRISDKSGRGVSKIIENYSENAFEFRENSIVVTIPFNNIRKVGDNIGDKVGDKNPVTRKHGLNETRQKILSEMRHNPNITKPELAKIIGISETAIDNNIRFLKNNNLIERIGSNKNGNWNVISG